MRTNNEIIAILNLVNAFFRIFAKKRIECKAKCKAVRLHYFLSPNNLCHNGAVAECSTRNRNDVGSNPIRYPLESDYKVRDTPHIGVGPMCRDTNKSVVFRKGESAGRSRGCLLGVL